MELKISDKPMNFRFLVDVEYETEFPGDLNNGWPSCGCSICRCKTITDTAIEPFDNSTKSCIFDRYLGNIKYKNTNTGRWNLYFKNKPHELSEIERERERIDLYCIDRLCVHHGVYNEGNYEVEVSGGYYGEEIDSVTFEKESKFMDDVLNVIKMSNNIDKVKFVIEKEYKFLLDRINACTDCRVTTFNLEHLTKNSTEFDRIKHNEDVYSDSLDQNIPIGIVHDDRILDGHNRTKGALINNYKAKDYIEIF